MGRFWLSNSDFDKEKEEDDEEEEGEEEEEDEVQDGVMEEATNYDGDIRNFSSSYSLFALSTCSMIIFLIAEIDLRDQSPQQS